jgi:hypothetical protein
MPIRFACPSCGQRLTVGEHKAGRSASCPKCQSPLTIPEKKEAGRLSARAAPKQGGEAPAEAEPAQPPASGAIVEPAATPTTSADDVPLPAPPPPPLAPAEAEGEPAFSISTGDDEPQFDFEGGVEIVYETPAIPPPRSAPRRTDDEALDFDRIAVPRYVVFTQGVLLAVVALVCFLLGMAIGGAVSERSGEPVAAQPISISGVVSVAEGGARQPDAGAVVILLPVDAQPDERQSLVGLRPGDDPTTGEQGRNFIRLLRGGVSRCDRRGEYAIELPDRGRYYLLAISANAQPKPGDTLPPQDLAQMARFFKMSEEPLAEFRFQWRIEPLRRGGKMNVTFD